MELVGALARILLVFALLGGVLVVLKRTGGVDARRAGALHVVASARLGKGAALTVVQLQGRELVLGVTDHAVTLLQLGAPAEGPAALPAAPAPSPVASAGAAVRRLLASRRPAAGAADDAREQPPSPTEFLGLLWTALRRQPLAESELSSSAVEAALAHATGTTALPASDSPAPLGSGSDLHLPGPRLPLVADGPATPDLPRTRSARTDAQLDEEHPWSRACAPAFRAAERVPALR